MKTIVTWTVKGVVFSAVLFGWVLTLTAVTVRDLSLKGKREGVPVVMAIAADTLATAPKKLDAGEAWLRGHLGLAPRKQPLVFSPDDWAIMPPMKELEAEYR